MHDIYGKLYEQAGYETLRKNYPVSQQVLKNITLARIAKPCSKMASVDLLEKDFGITHSLDAVYRMMDHLDEDKIKQLQTLTYAHTRQLYETEISVLFYDCTTLYFESFTEDELKENGYSKDNKFNQSQILLALLVTTDGLPVGYEVFNGSLFEGNTLETMLAQIKQQYNISRAIFVADSGLLSKGNIEKLQNSNIEYIVGARLKALSHKWQDHILDSCMQMKEQKKDDLLRYSSYHYNEHQRLIVSHSEKRAEKDRHDRDKALNRLQSMLSKSSNMKDLISNYGYKKYIKSTGNAHMEINMDKVSKDAQWDGLHGIFTNLMDTDQKQILEHYRGLWQIEESFRISKHDLKMRPVFHWTPHRIKAHIAICYMAFSLIRNLQYRLKKQYQPLSPEVIRNELLHLQTSILKHQSTEERYVVPSKPSQHAIEIYKTLGLKYQIVPFKLQGKI